MFDIRQLDVWPWLPLALFSALLALWYVQDVIAAVRMPRLDPHPDLPDTGPLVTVIIPARNEAARIGACLEGLARQSYRTFEVIVVDDDSADETVDVVRRFATRLPALTIFPRRGCRMIGQASAGHAGKARIGRAASGSSSSTLMSSRSQSCWQRSLNVQPPGAT